MFHKFTEQARRVVVLAQQDARHLADEYLRPAHLLLGLYDEPDAVALPAELGIDRTEVEAQLRENWDGPGPAALASIGIELDEVRRRVDTTFGGGALDRTLGGCAARGSPPGTPRSTRTPSRH